MAFDASGNLFVSVSTGFFFSDGYILEIPVSGPRTVFASGLSDPRGLAFDMSGDLYVTERSSGKIKRFYA